MSDLGTVALDYAARGIPVLPLHNPRGGACSCGRDECPSPAKHPRTRDGLTGASCDPDTIEEWWQRWPNANIGLRTGVAFDVLDIDGTEGRFSFQGWLNGRHMPAAPTSRTQSGGWHVLFGVTGCGNRAQMLDSVDWRGRGGYIVAPPSIGIRGPYRWIGPQELDAIPEAPRFLVELVDPPKPPPRPFWRPTAGLMKSGSKYAEAAFESELHRLGLAVNGGRNDALNRCAFALGQLVGAGALDRDRVAGELFVCAQSIGLGQTEAIATIASGLNRGMATPRQVPR